MAFVQDLEFYKEMEILLSFDKDVLIDPSWFSVEQPFTIKQAPCSVSLSLKSLVGLYQNPLALFLFSNSYVAEVSESSRLKEPWMSLLSKSKCTQFLYSPSTLVSLLQPKMAAVQGKWQGKRKKKKKSNKQSLKIKWKTLSVSGCDTYCIYIFCFICLTFLPEKKIKMILFPARILFVCFFLTRPSDVEISSI